MLHTHGGDKCKLNFLLSVDGNTFGSTHQQEAGPRAASICLYQEKKKGTRSDLGELGRKEGKLQALASREHRPYVSFSVLVKFFFFFFPMKIKRRQWPDHMLGALIPLSSEVCFIVSL